MATIIEAIFEHGVLRPLYTLPLVERQRVKLTIEELELSSQTTFSLSESQWEAFTDALEAPALAIPALQELLRSPSIFDGR